MPSNPLDRPLSDTDIDAFEDVIHTLAERADLPISLEFIDGFVAALVCAPRVVPPEEYFPALLGEGGLARCADETESTLLATSVTRRWNEIARALAAPVENLADPKALAPFLMDWQGLLEDLPPAERAEVEADGVPAYGQLWAEGFLVAVDTWADDWALPEGSKDEAFVDACLDPFYTLTTEPDEWTAAEKKLDQDTHVATAIWGVYDLFEFWRDRGLAPVAPIRVEATPGRNDECSCGSGKKYKKCCGAN